MTTKLTISHSHTEKALPLLDSILQQKELASTTAYRYRREVEVALTAGIDIWHRDELATYAAGLATSRKRFLKAAVRLLANELTDRAQAAANPDNIQQVQAAVFRAESLKRAITVKERKGNKVHTWLTPLETKMFLALPDVTTVKGRRDRIILALLVGAGLRRNEAIDLSWSQVVQQGDRTILAITGKGNKERGVPINPTLVAWLAAWQQELGQQKLGQQRLANRICVSVGKGGRIGQAISGQAILDIVVAYGREIGKEGLRPHDLRRTYARIGYDAGIDISQISLLLGHSSIRTTQDYLGLQIDINKSVSDYVPM